MMLLLRKSCSNFYSWITYSLRIEWRERRDNEEQEGLILFIYCTYLDIVSRSCYVLVNKELLMSLITMEQQQ